jgi:hypothetical protein
MGSWKWELEMGSSDTARLAQLVEHRSYEPKVTGSSPVSSIARVAQWLAYRSSKPGVAGSSPAVGILLKKVYQKFRFCPTYTFRKSIAKFLLFSKK